MKLFTEMFPRHGLLLLIAILTASCATLPENYPRTKSAAFPDYLETGMELYELRPDAGAIKQRVMSVFIMMLPVEHQL